MSEDRLTHQHEQQPVEQSGKTGGAHLARAIH
jgi:hypothetical protein